MLPASKLMPELTSAHSRSNLMIITKQNNYNYKNKVHKKQIIRAEPLLIALLAQMTINKLVYARRMSDRLKKRYKQQKFRMMNISLEAKKKNQRFQMMVMSENSTKLLL